MTNLKPLLLLLTLTLSTTLIPNFYAYAQGFNEYTSKVEVPEPLFIDLVRGLHSKKGEWEINSLIHHSQGTLSGLEWAPEIEIVVFDGFAIEFEFPIEGDSLKNYKFAMQKTLNPNAQGSTLHGLQFIYETDKRGTHHEETLFYILAHRYNFYLSSLTLAGVKTNSASNRDLDWSLNHSFFVNYSREIDFGLEVNYFSGETHDRMFQVIPQLHLALEPSYKIQFGFGATELESKWHPIAALRIIREFNSTEGSH